MYSVRDTVRDQRTGLAATLRARHLGMIAFGDAVGAGIFVGSGKIIAQTGPAVVICYCVIGVVTVLVMHLLAAQTRHSPDSGAFATHAGKAFGRIGQFAVGWMYWWMMVVSISVECTAASSIAHSWLPTMPAWAWALLFTGTLTALNLAPVRVFGEFQFWLVLMKILLLVAVPLLALLAIAGVLPNVHSAGTANITQHGGIFPTGSGAVFAGMLVAAFSFIGPETAAIAAGEAGRPRRTAPRVIRFVGYTVLVCYVVAMATTVLLLPWNDPAVAASPFGAMMTALHIPAAGTAINVAVFIAVLSVLNSCLYAASRVGFSLAKRQDAPRSWQRLSSYRVPNTAVVSAALVGFGVTMIGYVVPSGAFLALVDSAGAVEIMVWIAIALSYLKRPPHRDARLGRAAAGPAGRLGYVAWFVVLALVGMLIGMAFVPATQLQLIMTMLPVTIIFLVVLWRESDASADPD